MLLNTAHATLKTGPFLYKRYDEATHKADHGMQDQEKSIYFADDGSCHTDIEQRKQRQKL